jgi:hypothetical protein
MASNCLKSDLTLIGHELPHIHLSPPQPTVKKHEHRSKSLETYAQISKEGGINDSYPPPQIISPLLGKLEITAKFHIVDLSFTSFKV